MFRASTLPQPIRLALALPALGTVLAGCSMAGLPAFKPARAPVPQAVATVAPVPIERPSWIEEAYAPMAFAEAPSAIPAATPVDGLISKYASLYNVPESLVRRIVSRESGFDPSVRHGAYYGLMQIRHDTALSMGYHGDAQGLLDAETNLKYGVKYLRGAYVVAGYNSDGAVRYYARGYYYDAKRLGLLEEAGLR